MRIIDISPAIDASAPVWPGDVSFGIEPNWSIDAGDSVTVGTVRTTSHIGAHIDAPSHVIAGAPSADSIPLDACIGPCLVVDVSSLIDAETSPRGHAAASAVRERIAMLRDAGLSGERPGGAGGAEAAPIHRLILRHAAPSARSNPVWDPEIPGIDPELMAWFGEQGGRLVGIDLASFDPADSKQLPAHKAGLERGVVLLEGLDLSAAPEGEAELIALPLPWRGADASPVRAVLRLPEPGAS